MTWFLEMLFDETFQWQDREGAQESEKKGESKWKKEVKCMESGNNLLLCPAPVPLPNTRNIRREVQKFAIDFYNCLWFTKER